MADTGTPQIVGKAGVATSEFWVVALTIVGNFITHIFGHDWGIAENAQNIVLFGTAVAASIYTLARSWVKTGTHKAIAMESGANAAAVKNRFQLININGTYHLFDTVAGDLQVLWTEEKQAVDRAYKEQEAIVNDAKAMVKAPSYN